MRNVNLEDERTGQVRAGSFILTMRNVNVIPKRNKTPKEISFILTMRNVNHVDDEGNLSWTNVLY